MLERKNPQATTATAAAAAVAAENLQELRLKCDFNKCFAQFCGGSSSYKGAAVAAGAAAGERAPRTSLKLEITICGWWRLVVVGAPWLLGRS